MKSTDIRQKFLDFFKNRGHTVIPSAPLVPENDPTTLFISSGMQPPIPYLLGESHAGGKRLTNSQKSFRAADIDEVGDNRHTTFFEMLGNWSLGDYFKKEQLPWIFEFLTGELGLKPEKLYVSVFEGDNRVPRDNESIEIWKEIFSKIRIDAKIGHRIFLYPASKNWWSRSGEPENMPSGEPGGPDSEVFYDFGPELKIHEHSPFALKKCHLNCDCGRFLEIANSVFMQYQKKSDGSIKEMTQKNVDFGGGLERLTAASESTPDIFTTDMFSTIVRSIEHFSQTRYGEKKEQTSAIRIIADHIRGSVMMMAEGLMPSNKQQGYILRRLLRRSLLYGRILGLGKDTKYLGQLVGDVFSIYQKAYPEIMEKSDAIISQIEEESTRFIKTLEKGLREIEKVPEITGEVAFKIYETYGFPWEMTEEIARVKGYKLDRGKFEEEFKLHQEKSRTAASGMFKGGLADHSQKTTKLHTATHLLHQALRKVLGSHVSQKGSNITEKRLRFDYSHSQKLTQEEIKMVEEIVNSQIKRKLEVTFINSTYKKALDSGALAFFGERYPETVKVYSIGEFSKEICGGPHVKNTSEIGNFHIIKEESAGSGLRRIYAQVDN